MYHRLTQHRARLTAWLFAGALLLVCVNTAELSHIHTDQDAIHCVLCQAGSSTAKALPATVALALLAVAGSVLFVCALGSPVVVLRRALAIRGPPRLFQL